jgi:hypothetical protein
MRQRWLCVFSLAALSAPAVAAPKTKDKNACVNAFVEAQKLRKSGSLVKARGELVTCAQSSCPEVVRDKCVAWLPEVEAETPSVILVAKSRDGSDLTDVEVRIDQESDTHRIDGQSIPLDPGEHVFTFQRGDERKEQKVVLSARQKDRQVEVSFGKVEDVPKPVAARPKPGKKNVPVGVYVLGGVGVVALGSFGYFGITALRDKKDLEELCAPQCTQDEKESVDRKLLIADISLGVAVVSLGAATWIFLANRGESGEVAVHAQPAPGGGRANVRWSF